MTRITWIFSLAALSVAVLNGSTNAAFMNVALNAPAANLNGTGASFGSTPLTEAVDGIFGAGDGAANAYVSNASGSTASPFFRLSLVDDHEIDRVELWNRNNAGTQNHFYNITVTVRDAANNALWESAVFNPWDGVTGSPADPGLGPFVFNVPSGIVGENVLVRKTGADSSFPRLQIGEIEVYAMAVPEPAAALFAGIGMLAVVSTRRRRA